MVRRAEQGPVLGLLLLVVGLRVNVERLEGRRAARRRPEQRRRRPRQLSRRPPSAAAAMGPVAPVPIHPSPFRLASSASPPLCFRTNLSASSQLRFPRAGSSSDRRSGTNPEWLRGRRAEGRGRGRRGASYNHRAAVSSFLGGFSSLAVASGSANWRGEVIHRTRCSIPQGQETGTKGRLRVGPGGRKARWVPGLYRLVARDSGTPDHSGLDWIR